MNQTNHTSAYVVSKGPDKGPAQKPQENPKREIFNLHRNPPKDSQNNSTENNSTETPVPEKPVACSKVPPGTRRKFRISPSYEMRVKPGENGSIVYELVHKGVCDANLSIKPSPYVVNPEPFVLYVFRREAARREKVSYTTLFGTEDVEIPPWEREIPVRQIDALSLTYAACSLNIRGYAQRFIEECEGWLAFDPEREEWLARRNGEWEPARERLSTALQFAADSLFAEMCVWKFELETIRRAPHAEDRRRTTMIRELLTAYEAHLILIHQKVNLDEMLRISAAKGLRKKIVQKEPWED